MKNPETILAKNIMLYVNRLRDSADRYRARLIRNRLGSDSLTRIPFGLGTGSPDLVGVLASGRLFCVEVKMPKTGVIRESQKKWWRAAKLWKVTGGYARSKEEALELLGLAEHLEREAARGALPLGASLEPNHDRLGGQ